MFTVLTARYGDDVAMSPIRILVALQRPGSRKPTTTGSAIIEPDTNPTVLIVRARGGATEVAYCTPNRAPMAGEIFFYPGAGRDRVHARPPDEHVLADTGTNVGMYPIRNTGVLRDFLLYDIRVSTRPGQRPTSRKWVPGSGLGGKMLRNLLRGGR